MIEEFDLWQAAPYATGTGEADRPTLTAFTIPGPQPSPAVLVLPGGGYARHAEHEGAPVARWLNSLGVAAFVLRYRVAPYRYPVPLLDGQRAIRYLRRHVDRFGIDPGRVGVLGFSAGGHLAGLLATAGDSGPDAVDSGPGGAATTEGLDASGPGTADSPDAGATRSSDAGPTRSSEAEGTRHGDADPIDGEDPRPGLAVLCYPVVSMVGPVHESSMHSLLGPDPDGALRQRVSIENRVTTASPPMFVWHTADDPVVDAANAQVLADALTRQGVPHELHIYPHGPHGLGLAEDVPVVSDWTQRCAAFLKTHGW
ncbi:alpha/beta hydrolase [Rugosimonospora africana]|uniref:Acetyl esterase/lipase n=1 Tax=Rugosimonospora africana TaxID=556532 RepID=A0A8J3VQT2_9ACTN|nr:alpha/beta hydrolase [Rugosimonospora africana]GIH15372.1 hypothetical protein Raf01_35440 [Rugosimonospora africana]